MRNPTSAVQAFNLTEDVFGIREDVHQGIHVVSSRRGRPKNAWSCKINNEVVGGKGFEMQLAWVNQAKSTSRHRAGYRFHPTIKDA